MYTKKMSYFCGSNNLVMMYILFIFFFIRSSMAEHDEDQLFELFSREDMVQVAGYGEEKLSTVLISGSVHCETCLHDAQLHAWPMSGVLVGINCHKNGKRSKSNWVRAVTDEFGDFTIDLPSNLHSIPNLDKSCRVKVLRVPKKSMCQPTYVRRHKGLRLSSIQNGVRTYNAGRIRFQHSSSTPIEACVKKGNNNMAS
ncbi:uncharacterized protein LOC107416006 [Ziziphus jujuba]|uniref:Uncharacterized protein LOC107416006 n=2 Tax=Ziziphus jujuba TaxID=326968 RepID=A0A6P3ZWI0_ZIZJJ|nr:uncharacterized protein LOC107416006 [Ziziphus jujuba]KAH7545382.1 hypothetical protein FEM48_Zijuj01G0087600 [Ziziphus jujuba var. spinosa]